MKKIFILIYFLVLASITVIAQTSTTDSEYTNPDDLVEFADQALKVEIQTLNQEYPSKNIGFKAIITSEIDSGRAAIQWYYSSSYFKVVGESKENVTVTSNAKTEVTKYFTPIIVPNEKNQLGFYTIGFKVSALTYERNYLTIAKKNFMMDGNFQLIPLTDYYRQAKTEFDVNKMLTSLLIAGSIMLVIAFILGRFLKFVNTKDVEK